MDAPGLAVTNPSADTEGFRAHAARCGRVTAWPGKLTPGVSEHNHRMAPTCTKGDFVVSYFAGAIPGGCLVVGRGKERPLLARRAILLYHKLAGWRAALA
jgi:hypothetical protein